MSDSAQNVVDFSRDYRPALMAFFLRRVHSHAEAEDLTQEVFCRLAAQGEFDVRSGSAYLFQTAANLLRDRARRARVRTEYRQTLGEIEAQSIDLIDPFRVAAAKDSVAAMRAALEALDETTGTIFVLYRLEHMRKEVIADTFGMSVRTVEKHLTKAMAFLANRFGGDR